MKLLAVAAVVEIVVGLVLVADPAFAARLLLGAQLAAPGQAVGRVAGFGLFALGLACWPLPATSNDRATRGLLAYNALASIFFLYLGISHQLVGVLLWPAAVGHGILSVLLVRLFAVSKTT